MDSNGDQDDTQKEREIMYEFWSKLPYIKVLDPEVYEDRKNPIRNAIIKLLRKGVPEKDKNGNEIRRYAMSAKEILTIIKKMKIVDRKYDISSLYFHIKRGLDVEVIQKVAIIPEGNHNITYYGRTAQNFLSSRTANPKYAEKFQKEASKIADLMISIDSNFNKQKFLELTDDYLIYVKKRDNRINQVLKENEEFIQTAELGIKEVYDFLRLIDVHQQKLKILEELSGLLPLKLDIE